LYSHIGSENNNDVIEEAINFINDKIKEICNIGENSSEKEKREFKNEYNRDIIEGVIKEKLSLI
jgi:polyribonucleotide nucleotidyltransferase